MKRTPALSLLLCLLSIHPASAEPAKEENAQALKKQIEMACWHEGEKLVHAAIMNRDSAPHALLVGMKEHDCRSHGDDGWTRSFRSVEIPARTVLILSMKASADGTFLAFAGKVDPGFDAHDCGKMPPHLVQSFWVLSEPKRLARHIAKQGETVRVPWRPERGASSVTFCLIDRRQNPGLEVEPAKDVWDLTSLPDKEREERIEQLALHIPVNAAWIQKAARNGKDASLKIACVDDAEIPFLIDTAKVGKTGCISFDIGKVDTFMKTGHASGGAGVLKLLIYEADMAVVEKTLE